MFSVLPSIIPAKELDRANSQITGAQLVIDEFVGPPLGGFLFAVTAALPIGASSFACGVASLAFFLLRDRTEAVRLVRNVHPSGTI